MLLGPAPPVGVVDVATAVALGNEAGTAVVVVAAGFVQLVVTQAVTTTAATSTSTR